MQSKSTQGKTRKSTKFIPIIIVIILLLLGVFTISFFLSDTSRTQTTVKTESETVSMLKCTSKIVENPFFQAKAATTAEHEVKISFKDDVISKISYTYQGKFSSTEIAKESSAKMHADYNTYMGKDSEKLSPHFNNIDSEVSIALYSEMTHIDSKNAKLFFLNDEMLSKLTKLDQKSLRDYYANKGFTCKYAD